MRPPNRKAALVAALIASSPAAASADFYSGIPSRSVQSAASVIQTALETLPSGQRADWVGRDQGFGYVKPIRTWKSVSGHFCRSFEERLYTSGGKVRSRELTACRVKGTWRLVEE
jgi:surface antigen